MERAHLYDYIRTAAIVQQGPLQKGGGHQDKQIAVLDGGVGVVMKLAPTGDGTKQTQVRAECAAPILADMLGWSDLVPVTAMRVVTSLASHEQVAGSVQVALPLFKPAAELTRQASSCPDEEIWRVAVFDALAINTDRNATNWGFVEGIEDRPKLIDHGHAFGGPASGAFDFIELCRGRVVPDRLRDRLRERLVGPGLPSELVELLPAGIVQLIEERARTFVETGDFAV
jgi:hypothetical protein